METETEVRDAILIKKAPALARGPFGGAAGNRTPVRRVITLHSTGLVYLHPLAVSSVSRPNDETCAASNLSTSAEAVADERSDNMTPANPYRMSGADGFKRLS